MDLLYYLDQHLVGEPKKLISSCFYMPPAHGYSRARQLLEAEYGDPYKAAMTHLSELNEWSNISSNDSLALRDFYLSLVKCQCAVQSLSYSNVLDTPHVLQTIVSKLPSYLQNKWRESVHRIRNDERRVPCFNDVVHFVSKASATANDPVFGQTALSFAPFPSPSSSSPYPSPSASSLGRRPSAPKQVTSECFKTEITPLCPLCEGSHDLNECGSFLNKSMDDRRQFVLAERLCFACFGRNHRSRACRERKRCGVCTRMHPTSMHGSSNQQPAASGGSNTRSGGNENHNGQAVQPSNDAACHNASSQPSNSAPASGAVSSCATTGAAVLHSILPVMVSQKGSSRKVMTYAFYDNGSSGCFITSSFAEELDAVSNPVTLQLRTMHGDNIEQSKSVDDLLVTDLDGKNEVHVGRLYTKESIPVSHEQIPQAHMLTRWPHLASVAPHLPPFLPSLQIGLLIGSNCPRAMEPQEVCPSGINSSEGPYAVRLRHGWTVHGPVSSSDGRLMVHRVAVAETKVSERFALDSLIRSFNKEFQDSSYPDEKGWSQEDSTFMRIVESGKHFDNGHYIVPLPFRHDVNFPDNRVLALKRAHYQRTKMEKDPKYKADYVTFVEEMVKSGYASPVPDEQLQASPGKVWYIPHHGVYNPNKPGKIRVVYDCSASFMGVSLNDELLQGPNLTNSLIGVLIRFRLHYVAFQADIEKMFFQVVVPPEQRSFLRFFWWADGDLRHAPKEYHMNVHLFGAASSPSVVNYALRQVACDAQCTPEVSDTIQNHFYVDDCLRSVETPDCAIQLIEDLRDTCSKKGFRLTKFVSNSVNVMNSVPPEERSKESQGRNFDYDPLPIERALGIQWNVENDEFGFQVKVPKSPSTRRGILSAVSSTYDPLGFVCPIVLAGKQILQELCKIKGLSWDDPIPEDIERRWLQWKQNLPQLAAIRIPRCLKRPKFGTVVNQHLIAFSDASFSGYGAVVYLRQENQEGDVCSSLLIAKARVAPLKPVTVPRLELTAAVTAVKLAISALKELRLECEITFFTDSAAVLAYIRSDQQRWPIFVANRIATIRNFSHPSQWRYVPSRDNPADMASRGAAPGELSTAWWNGPPFLSLHQSSWPMNPPNGISSVDANIIQCSKDDMAMKVTSPTSSIMSYWSSWHKTKVCVAVFLKVKRILLDRVRKTGKIEYPVTAMDLDAAEGAILMHLHSTCFPDEVQSLSVSTTSKVKVSSSLASLDPFIDNGILHVGGRMRSANLSDRTKCPIILPKGHHVTHLIIRSVHVRLGHAGRTHVLSALRERYWIIHGNASVRRIIHQCVQCRRLRSPCQEQQMADLPDCRLDDTQPPFSHTGVDFFGPFLVKERRSTVKRYGVVFTCLSSRAVHLEIATNLDTDSCINAIRRFIARRGRVASLYSDNGTNFVSANKELSKAINMDALHSRLRQRGISWNFNPPTASHMGGAWERMIRSVRQVLSGLLLEYGERLDTESLMTLLCEVEAIINSRPLTSMADADDPEPLSPLHILTGKCNPCSVFHPGQFQRADVFLRRRWRRVQYLAQQFWTRWRREYLVELQRRQKWTRPSRNLCIGDIVLLADDGPRTDWPMGKVKKVDVGNKQLVRSVEVTTKSATLRRPVTSLVLLLEGS